MLYDYLVVGAGPAGLAFASSMPDMNVLVVDLGKAVSERNRFHPEECVQGAGGAGLFSDGKFSFYPAGTKIWEQDRQRLEAAYQILKEDLSPFGFIPEFPEITSSNKRELDHGGWLLKPYKSIYLTLENRIDLIDRLTRRCSHIMYQTAFLEQSKIEGGYLVKLRDIVSGELRYIQTRQIIFAGGRFMPLFLNCPKKFQRYEFGFRVVWPTSLMEKEVNSIDPKYIFEYGGIEYRTFCWCENGEVVKTAFKGIETYSGRADCPPTGMSNFGLNIRIKDPSLFSKAALNTLLSMPSFDTSMNMFSSNLSIWYKADFVHVIQYGLNKLLDRFKGLCSDYVRVIGPTMEGVGEYPNIDSDFQLEENPGIYVIGDCSGIYRGIIASMLAGYLLAVTQNQRNVENTRNLVASRI